MTGFLRKSFTNVYFIIGSALILFLLAVSLTGTFYTPFPPNAIDLAKMSMPPGNGHFLGTDMYGRDILSRIMFAGKTAFLVSLSSVGLSLSIGIIFGLLSGLIGGVVGLSINKATDVMRSVPGILFAMMIIAVLGKGLANTVFAICFITVPAFTRVIRSSVLQVKSNGYIEWARLTGIKKSRIAFIHILPNIISPVIVTFSTGMANAILTEASLSFLGLGVQPPDPSWGQMLSEAQSNILNAPWEAISVGACVSLLVLGFNLLGDGLRDVFDVRSVN